MAMQESKWQSAWVFLSLDQTNPYFSEMWFPLANASEFQSELRTLLLPWLDEEKFYSESGALHYTAARWFEERYGVEAFEHLADWVRYIFVNEGSDRVPEALWMAIALNSPLSSSTGFQLSSDPTFQVSTWVSDLMTKIKNDLRSNVEIFNDRVETEQGEMLSEWDSKILGILQTEPQIVTSKISLIARSNIFLKVWENYCSQLEYSQLYNIWNLAKQVAPHIGMQDMLIPFPSNWRFELRKFL